MGVLVTDNVQFSLTLSYSSRKQTPGSFEISIRLFSGIMSNRDLSMWKGSYPVYVTAEVAERLANQ